MGNKYFVVTLCLLFFSLNVLADNPGRFRPFAEAELALVEKALSLELPSRDFEKLTGHEQAVWGKKHRFVYAVSHPRLFSNNICRYHRRPIESSIDASGDLLAKFKDVHAESFAAYVSKQLRKKKGFSCDKYRDQLQYINVKYITDDQIEKIWMSLDKLVRQGRQYINQYPLKSGASNLTGEDRSAINIDDFYSIKLWEYYYHEPLINTYQVTEKELYDYPLVGTVSYDLSFYNSENKNFYGLLLSAKNGKLRVVGAGIGTQDGYPTTKTLGLDEWEYNDEK